MWSFITVMHNCGIQLFHGTVKFAVAILDNVSLCLLYMWHNYITVVSLYHYNTCSAWFLDIRIFPQVKALLAIHRKQH